MQTRRKQTGLKKLSQRMRNGQRIDVGVSSTENLARQIAVGEADIAAGREQDLNEVLEEIHRASKVLRSLRHRSKSRP
jgi:hypothetical protein